MEKFTREQLLNSLDQLGRAAIENGTQLDLAIYGGSALMLASNFRYATEDVDIAEVDYTALPWLKKSIQEIAAKNGWENDWLNDAVQFHLSPSADKHTDHVLFSTFPHGSEPGLRVFVPTAEYMLALKLKALRINDPAKGPIETADIQNLIRVNGLGTPDQAIAILGKFFPKSAEAPEKQLFLLRHIWPKGQSDEPPTYPG